MSLGGLEQVVLFALLRTGDRAHGAGLVLEIEERTGRHISPGALYTVLGRLSEKGYVEGWIGESTPERGGHRRKVYRLTPAGANELLRWYQGIVEIAAGTHDRLEALAAKARANA